MKPETIITDTLIGKALSENNFKLSQATKDLIIQYAVNKGIEYDTTKTYLESKVADYLTNDISSSYPVYKCSSCGGNIPVISKVCEFCGSSVHPPDEPELTIENLTAKLQENLENLKKIPVQTFLRSIWAHYYFFLPILALYLLFFISRFAENLSRSYAIVILGYSFFIVTGIFAITLLINIIRRKQGNTNPEFFKAEFDKYYGIAFLFYGANVQIKKMLNEFQVLTRSVENEHKKKNKYQLIGYMILILVLASSTVFLWQKSQPQKSNFYSAYDEFAFLYNCRVKLTPTSQKPVGCLVKQFEIAQGAYDAYIQNGFDDIAQRPWCLMVGRVKIIKKQNFDYYKVMNSLLPIGDSVSNYNFDLKLILLDNDKKPLIDTLVVTKIKEFNDFLKQGQTDFFVNFQYYFSGSYEDQNSVDSLNVVRITRDAKYFSIFSTITKRNNDEEYRRPDWKLIYR